MDSRQEMREPRRTWTDALVRWLRTNAPARAVFRWSWHVLVPLLLALAVALPIGVVMYPFFVPKFIRNARRRRRYGVTLSSEPMDRIGGTDPDDGGSGPRAGNDAPHRAGDVPLVESA